jgi:AbiV family abortive infection protein
MGVMTVSRDPKDRCNRSLANAKRLNDDAILLGEHGRHASAYALAILAVEEMGQALIELWGSDFDPGPKARRASRHIQKQSAVAALIMAHHLNQRVEPLLDELGIRPAPYIPSDQVDGVLDKLVAEFEGSPSMELLQMSSFGIIDLRKQGAFYADLEEEGPFSVRCDDFDGERLEEGLQLVKLANEYIKDMRDVAGAKAVFLSRGIQSWMKASRSFKSSRPD